jgi:MYXO-CTERM domain-containing protein
MRLTPSILLASAVGLAVATPAAAHVALTDPPARYDSQTYIKDYPCGHPDNPEGESTRTYEEGATITVQWNEYIGHPGHFRIALSTEGDQALIDPTDYDDFYSAPNVILDDIEDPDGVADHSVEITLPAGVTCEKCTLQLLQIMTDKMPWGPAGGNELYYQCADITITPVGAGTEGGNDTTGGGESGGSGSSEGGGETTDDGVDPSASASATAGNTTADPGTDTTDTPGGGTSGVTDGDAADDGDSGCGCTSAEDPDFGALALGVLVIGAIRRRRAA